MLELGSVRHACDGSDTSVCVGRHVTLDVFLGGSVTQLPHSYSSIVLTVVFFYWQYTRGCSNSSSSDIKPML